MRDAGRLLIVLMLSACSEDSTIQPPPAIDPGATGIGNTRGIGARNGGSRVSVTCAPDNGGIALPPGFCATVFAKASRSLWKRRAWR